MSGWRAGIADAVADLSAALERRWLWGALGWNDVRQRHSGSVLGSLWISANIVLLVACLTLVFGGALGESVRTYAPYVAIGLALWQFVNASISEGSLVFVTASESIRNSPLPLSLHVFRLVWRNLVVFAHHLVLLPVLILVFAIAPGAGTLLAIPGLALLTLFAFFAALLLGLLGARFRDVAPVVGNFMQLLFFLTPVFWQPGAIGPLAERLAAINPLTALIDIVRAPLLGEATHPLSWPIALAATALATAAAFAALAGMRSRLPYWV